MGNTIRVLTHLIPLDIFHGIPLAIPFQWTSLEKRLKTISALTLASQLNNYKKKQKQTEHNK